MRTSYIWEKILIILEPKLTLHRLMVYVEGFIELCKMNVIILSLGKRFIVLLEELQLDVDHWLHSYNRARPHSGKYCYGKTPIQTFFDSMHIAYQKILITLKQILISVLTSSILLSDQV